VFERKETFFSEEPGASAEEKGFKKGAPSESGGLAGLAGGRLFEENIPRGAFEDPPSSPDALTLLRNSGAKW